MASQAQLAAKEAMLASQAAAVTPPPLMPYSKTFGRTSVAAVHASDGKGLSLVRFAGLVVNIIRAAIFCSHRHLFFRTKCPFRLAPTLCRLARASALAAG